MNILYSFCRFDGYENEPKHYVLRAADECKEMFVVNVAFLLEAAPISRIAQYHIFVANTHR